MKLQKEKIMAGAEETLVYSIIIAIGLSPIIGMYAIFCIPIGLAIMAIGERREHDRHAELRRKEKENND